MKKYRFFILALVVRKFGMRFVDLHLLCGALKLPKDPTVMKSSDYMNLPELVCRFQGRLHELLQNHPAAAIA